MTIRLWESRTCTGLLAHLGIQKPQDALLVQGTLISSDGHSSCLKLTGPKDAKIYLKRFSFAFPQDSWKYRLFRDPVETEIAAFALLRNLGLSTPKVLAWGRYQNFWSSGCAFVITAEIPKTTTLEDALSRGIFTDSWRRRLAQDLGAAVARIHRAHYVDRDLHFRNLLVSFNDHNHPLIHFIDSPKGAVLKWPWRRRKLARRDLACLDKHAPKFFSRTERLRFFLAYLNCKKLNAKAKVLARQVRAKADRLMSKRQRKLSLAE